ncbi:CHAT domain-containing protein [Boletus coccyginus]|nr:CHAT domain-containing protein [Boletus coccyginus]
MSYLAGLLYIRFEQQGATSDLDEGSFPFSATHWNLAPRETPIEPKFHRATSQFPSMPVSYGSERCLTSTRQLPPNATYWNFAHGSTPGHPDRAFLLGDLASSLYSRFHQLGTLSDLDEANATHWNFARRGTLIGPFHSASSRVPSIPVSSGSERYLISMRQLPSTATHWNFAHTGMLIEPLYSANSRIPSIPVSSSSERCLTSTRQFPSTALGWHFARRGMHIESFHWATSGIPSVLVLSSSDCYLTSTRQLLSSATHWNFARRDTLIEPFHWVTSRFPSIPVSSDSGRYLISMRRLPSNATHWNFARRDILIEPLHWATLQAPCIPVFSGSDHYLTSTRQLPSNAMHWNFARRAILIESSYSANSRIPSIPVLSSSDHCLTSKRQLPSDEMHWKFAHRSMLIELFYWVTLQVHSIPVSSSSDHHLTLTRQLPSNATHWNFAQRDMLIDPSYWAPSRDSRFQQLGTLSDLDEAVTLQRNALELCAQGHAGRPFLLGTLAISLHSRFEQLGSLSDLDEAVALNRNSSELRPQGHPHRVFSLGHLAGSLHSRFLYLGALSDLDEAVALARNALELCPQEHAHRPFLLGELAYFLHSRFEQLGSLSDLDEAVALHRNALEVLPQGHAHRPFSLSYLAYSLHSRFKQLGSPSDLDGAVTLQRNALELCAQGHAYRPFLLGTLAIFLHSRFEQLGSLFDLDEAVALKRNALELRPQGHPHRAFSLGHLAGSLHSRFQRLGTLLYLDEAVALHRNASELCSQGHADRASLLGNLAGSLHSRFLRLGSLSDLDEAVSLERNASELSPQGHPHRAFSLSYLADSLRSRFQRLGSLSDLDEAVSLERNTLELRPPGHPRRGYSLATALYLNARFKHSDMHATSDLRETFDLYSQLSDISQTAAEDCEHSTTISAYQIFFHFIVQYLATLPSLPQHLALLKQLTTSTVVDAFSACIRYGNPANAVELLEQGRGIFWSQLIRLRSPLDDVIASGGTGKKLADRFTQSAFLFRRVLDGPTHTESQHDQACRLNIQLQDIIANIRKLPDLSRFLQPLLFLDLQNAATGGPVIIVNASKYGCDALIVLPDRDPAHVALPITKAGVSELSLKLHFVTSRARFRDVTKELLMLLRELWDMVVFPIVEVLQECHPNRSRIWWCPTAEFSFLPLHAAGSFRKGQPMFSDLYISSYTPTLTALIRARQKRSVYPSTERRHVLVVGQAQAPGQSELVAVNAELSSISQRIGSVATLTCVQDQDASITKVTEESGTNEFVYLACHGVPDRRRPFESGFALSDGLLTVEKIMQYDLQNAQFAYLSACHTTVGDEESPDEALHLAAAMQFAGFSSVIGTMWAVDDEHTNEITPRFHNHMMDESGHLDHTRAALALHKTMSSLRSSKIPLDQRILYIHIGA